MATYVEYPTPFEQKVLMHEGVGTEIEEVDLVIPSLTRPGDSFDMRVAIRHESGLPCSNIDVVLSVKLGDTGEVFDITFKKGAPAVGTIKDVCIQSEGLFRFETVLNGVTYYSNPSFCSNKNDEGIYWGDPHLHTILSLCHPEKCRTLNFCYTAARHVSLLDWASAADHVSNGRCDFSKWREQSITGNLYNDVPGFVTLPAYEASLKGGCGGDNNVYMKRYPEMFVDQYEEGDVATLSEGVSEHLDKSDYIIVPHHTSRPGKHGEISTDIYPGEETMPVMEIHSKWGRLSIVGIRTPCAKLMTGPVMPKIF